MEKKWSDYVLSIEYNKTLVYNIKMVLKMINITRHENLEVKKIKCKNK